MSNINLSLGFSAIANLEIKLNEQAKEYGVTSNNIASLIKEGKVVISVFENSSVYYFKGYMQNIIIGKIITVDYDDVEHNYDVLDVET